MTDMRKPIFDAVKAARGEEFSVADVETLDRALDKLGVPREAAPAPAGAEWKPAAIKLMHEFEGFAKLRPDGSVEAYPDPGTGGAPWTIGWGSTTDEDGKAIERGTVWSRERANARFEQDVERFSRKVRALLGDAPTSDNQFAALVSLAYNIGTGALAGSTLLKLHKAGDFAGAQRQFARWNKAGGRVLPGLTRRRAAEAELYAS